MAQGLELRRTGWDIALGLLMVVAGFVVLGNVVMASVVSVRLMGWMALFIGVVLFIGAWFKMGTPEFWFGVIGGPLLFALGLGFLRNTAAALAAITLLAGCIYFALGVARLVGAFALRSWIMGLSGAVTLLLALMVLYGWPESALWLVGVLVGVSAIVDGIALAIGGRLRPVGSRTPATA